MSKERRGVKYGLILNRNFKCGYCGNANPLRLNYKGFAQVTCGVCNRKTLCGDDETDEYIDEFLEASKPEVSIEKTDEKPEESTEDAGRSKDKPVSDMWA